MRRFDIWLMERPDHKARPVLVLARNELLDSGLSTIPVAAVTTTIRLTPSRVTLGRAEGLNRECSVNLTDLASAPRWSLTTKLGQVAGRDHEICAALNAVVDC